MELKIFKTKEELYDFTLKNNKTIIERVGYLVTFSDGSECIAGFED